ncbi:hypothetical protein LB456_11080 [Psychroflexus sp. CAK57W]|uniref:hypothetical protein n=1 Tax=Psychroflexus curvus TaxID=2873595 RepID=UPI001CCE4E05|nr:hypothetical protein [Psychroflexus curvus]MBZ9628552.1 hypothetical protein [Psychroflexus curvus]MBZ9788000.1 hypothetical protein [Psychroflexus curvus]
MKTKPCVLCKEEFEVLYRIQIKKGKAWIFACKTCLEKHQELPNYKYGGTWKGKRH